MIRESSHRTYEQITRNGIATRSQQIVLDAIADHPDGLTRREIEEATGLRSGSVTGRVNELIALELLREDGIRSCNITGRRVHVVKIHATDDKAA